MSKILIYPVGSAPSCRYAAQRLSHHGFQLVDHPTPEVTHLLLDIPSFSSDGQLRGGGDPARILEMLPRYITVIGGGLDHPAVENHWCMDLLKDDTYLAANAAITAECALQVAAPMMDVVFFGCPVLIIGWGRIGKCLAQLLKAIGANVTVAARKPSDRAILQALGYQTADPGNLQGSFKLIFNTAPAPVLNQQQLSRFPNCVKIDLASRKGLEGDDVVWARGLPGIHAPQSTGRLIADTVERLIKEA